MDIIDLADDADPRDATTFIAALDGWTDSGRGGTAASDFLRHTFPTEHLGGVDADGMFDFRDRRPLLPINRGVLGSPEWPSLELYRVDLPTRSVILLTGAEPDFRWPSLLDDLVELTDEWGMTGYIGLGAVPGPVPHTRPVRILTTSTDESMLDRYGHSLEQVVVPASCQVMIESAMGEAGRKTLGLWARVPHYVAGEYPAATSALLTRLGEHLDTAFDTTSFDADALSHTERLAEAADGSPEVESHIAALEGAYDAEDDNVPEAGFQLEEREIPSGDEIAAEFERFLRDRPAD